MRKLTQLDFANEDIESYVENDILVINIKQNVFEIVTDLSESNFLFDLFNLGEEDRRIKIIFLYNSPNSLCEEVYQDYINSLLVKSEKISPPFLTADSRQIIRSRQINILNHFIQEALALKKLFIVGLQGCVVTPFFGASLSSDLRFAANDMIFSLAHLKYGIHPTGALPFFLPKYIGPTRANQLLFGGGNVSAQKALELGLINQVFPTETFLSDALRELKRIAKLEMNVIQTTKKLMKIDSQDIRCYFEEEGKIALF